MPVLADWCLKPKNEVKDYPYLLGYNCHGLIFDCLRGADPEMSNAVHQDNQIRPFSLSFPNLYYKSTKNDESDQKNDSNGTSGIVMRIGMTDDTMALRMLNILDHAGDLRLGSMPIENEVMKLVKMLSSEQAIKNAVEMQAINTFSLRFLTPTFFQSKTNQCLFPAPDILFGSLANRMPWTQMGFKSDYNYREMNRKLYPAITVEKYQLETLPLKLDRYDSEFRMGFAGWCDYAVRLGPDDPLRLHLASMLVLMPFLGVGYKTTKGYGSVEN